MQDKKSFCAIIGKTDYSKEGFPMLIRAITILLVLLFCDTAQATVLEDCIDACFSGFSCTTSVERGFSMHDCQTGRQHCVEQCNRDRGGKDAAMLPPVGNYGAIAFDKKSGAWGMSDTSKDNMSAKKTALAYCKQHGDNCEIVESFSKSCAAIATGSGNRFGWGVNESPRQAALDAIKKCSVKNPTDNICFVQLYHCYPQ